jgi:sugar phosphate isomerase/epimerase
MKTSLSIWSVHKYVYAKSMDNEAFIDFVGTTGAEGVELLSVFWNKDGHEVKRLQQALIRNKLKLACFGACNNLAVSDPEARLGQLKDITDSVDKAVELGASIVRVFSGDKDPEVTYDQAKSWIINGLKEAAQYAENKGITLCLENHGYFAGKAEQVLEVIQEVGSPFLKSTFDTGNFLLVDDNPNEAIIKLKDQIAHVHFKDYSIVEENYQGNIDHSINGIRYAGKVPGEGIVDLRNILAQLKQNSYYGWLTVEYEGDEEQKEGSIRSINNLQQILSTL